tara:strand:- start:1121 stop:1765 length:645 start_codon:yes stop_codon:yes gene_type:complete
MHKPPGICITLDFLVLDTVWSILSEKHVEVLQMVSAKKIEKTHNRVLTTRQKTFAKFITEGVHSNAECARKAGYVPNLASKQAAVLLNGIDYPHVLEYVQELREEKERRYGVTLMGQMERFHKLSLGAEEAGQFSAAVNAEKIRSALGGLTIDRRENINTLDQLSRDEIVARLSDLQKRYPQAFAIEGEYKVVNNEQRSRGQLLESDQEKSAET